MNGGINSFLFDFSPFPNYIAFHKLQWLPLLFTIVEIGIETHPVLELDAHPSSSTSTMSLRFRDENN